MVAFTLLHHLRFTWFIALPSARKVCTQVSLRWVCSSLSAPNPRSCCLPSPQLFWVNGQFLLAFGKDKSRCFFTTAVLGFLEKNDGKNHRCINRSTSTVKCTSPQAVCLLPVFHCCPSLHHIQCRSVMLQDEWNTLMEPAHSTGYHLTGCITCVNTGCHLTGCITCSEEVYFSQLDLQRCYWLCLCYSSGVTSGRLLVMSGLLLSMTISGVKTHKRKAKNSQKKGKKTERIGLIIFNPNFHEILRLPAVIYY
ncbi:hypothetical protein L7F22_027450 [Adiantum nelumboides]|nr:hypothetical protein [Adiantum nelumboides]